MLAWPDVLRQSTDFKRPAGSAHAFGPEMSQTEQQIEGPAEDRGHAEAAGPEKREPGLVDQRWGFGVQEVDWPQSGPCLRKGAQ